MFIRSSWQGSTTPEDSSNVFYNARVSIQDPSTLTPLVYVDNRASAVLDNPADYRAAVVRFSVPTAQIPLFFYESTVSVPPCPPGGESLVRVTNPNTSAVGTAELVLQSTDANNPNNPAITQVQQYLNMLNTATQAAGFIAGVSPTPYVVFNPTTQLFELRQSTSVGFYKIEVSYPVARLFGAISLVTNVSYPYTGPGTGFFEWAPPTTPVNINPVTGAEYLQSIQEYSTYGKWQSLRNISFQVFGIPTTSEYLSSSSGVRIAGQGVEAGADLVSFVLTDFEPLAGTPDRGVIQFFPQGPLRWYNLLGNVPLRAITIQVLYTDERGVTRPILVGYEDTFTLKIEFRRRELNLT
jgi:hypothetical protein